MIVHQYIRYKMKKLIQSIVFLIIVSSIQTFSKKIDNEKLVNQVFNSIYTKVKSELKLPYNISIQLLESKDINAYANFDDMNEGDYLVIITTAMMDSIVRGNKDALAFIIGHEIAHITQNHLEIFKQRNTPYKLMVFTRSNEFEADTVGMKYALMAGYSAKEGIKLINTFITKGFEYTSFEGIGSDHPSWSERLQYLDKERHKLWKSMSAFSNGTYFLEIEHYAPAEYCFRAVIKEFPNCYEAYANLGYCLLMQYFDTMSFEDFENYNIGLIITGAFYRRSETFGYAVRGINSELWWDAVGHLREALRIEPNQAIVYSNLGLAYLLHPNGKDIKNSTKFFQTALDMLEKDNKIDDVSKMIVYLNAGVAYLADGNFESSTTFFEKVDKMSLSFEPKVKGETKSFYNYITSCLNYNKAFLMSLAKNSDKGKIKSLLEDFLLNTSKSSYWWSIAKRSYDSICSELKLIPNRRIGQDDINTLKPIVGVNLNKIGSIHLSDDYEKIIQVLHNEEIVISSVVQGTNLKQIYIEKFGIELLTSDKVLSIFLKNENSPSILIETKGISGKKVNIKAGMSLDEFEKAIGIEKDNYTFSKILNWTTKYRYYKNLGIAVKVDSKKNNVEEIVIINLSSLI